MNESISIPIRDVMPDYKVTVKVTGVKTALLRMRLGMWLLWVAACVASAIGRLDVEIKA